MKRRYFLELAALTALSAPLTALAVRTHSQSTIRQFWVNEPWQSNNLFLQGINAPTFAEVDVESLSVTGKIPADLGGIYMRNGPNPLLKPELYRFPLDGDGMIHAVYIENGTARYRNRWIQTKGLQSDLDPNQEPSELLRNYANTSIVAHGGKILALYEVGLPYELTAELNTIGEWDFQGGIQQAMTAH